MPALYVISFARTKKDKFSYKYNRSVNFWSNLLLWSLERRMCRQCSQTYGQRGFSRTGMNDLPLTISLQLVSVDTPTCHVSTKSFITLKTIIRRISPFPAIFLLLGFLAKMPWYWALWPWERSQSCGRHFGLQVTSSYPGPPPAPTAYPLCCSSQFSPPAPMPRGTSQSPFLAHSSRAWSFMLPLTEHYHCSSCVWYKRALMLFMKRTSASFPVHPRRHMVGISKSGNHVKPFEVLGSVQKAISSLKTMHVLNTWKYFNLSTLILTATTTREMNKPKLFLFYSMRESIFYGYNSPSSITLNGLSLKSHSAEDAWVLSSVLWTTYHLTSDTSYCGAMTLHKHTYLFPKPNLQFFLVL